MIKTSRRRVAGVSMIELLIVLAIVAILAAFAMKSYRQYILRGNRTYATGPLQDLSSREENYYFSNNTYTKSLSNLGLTTGNSPSTGTALYTLSVASASSTDYTVEAVATGTQTQDSACPVFQLTREGQKLPSNTASTCWGGQ